MGMAGKVLMNWGEACWVTTFKLGCNCIFLKVEKSSGKQGTCKG